MKSKYPPESALYPPLPSSEEISVTKLCLYFHDNPGRYVYSPGVFVFIHRSTPFTLFCTLLCFLSNVSPILQPSITEGAPCSFDGCVGSPQGDVSYCRPPVLCGCRDEHLKVFQSFAGISEGAKPVLVPVALPHGGVSVAKAWESPLWEQRS